MLLRFALPRAHPDSGVEEGIFGAVYNLRAAEDISDKPGYVVFEDDHQVVAEPFRGERK